MLIYTAVRRSFDKLTIIKQFLFKQSLHKRDIGENSDSAGDHFAMHLNSSLMRTYFEFKIRLNSAMDRIFE